MIPELDRYHGAVLRQLLVAHRGRAAFGIADLSGRVDAFCFDQSAFQIKHSSKRLSPWHFTYMPEHLAELSDLRRTFDPVWVFLVCGEDGVVGLSLDDLTSVAQIGEGGAAWLRISRSRNSMYRVSGALGELPRATSRGVQGFLQQVLDKRNGTSTG